MKKMLTLFLVVFFSQAIFANQAYIDYRKGDYQKALAPLESLSEKKDKQALYYLGQMTLYGYGIKRDTNKAIELITQSADRGFKKAQLFLGAYYLNIKKDPKLAFKWYQKAAKQGSESAQMLVAGSYKYGFGVDKNAYKSYRYIIDAAKNGNAHAQYLLGKRFLKSRHYKSRRLGLIWLNKSAEKGNVYAIRTLAKLYHSGKYVSKDENKAKQYLEKLKQSNDANAHYLLGQYYQDSALLHERALAISFYKNAALKHHMKAQRQLGLLFLTEDPNLKNEKKGFLWIKKASESGDKKAQDKLAELYKKGVGTKKNLNAANFWQQLASNNDNEAPIMAWLYTDKLNKSLMKHYKPHGILNDWHNESALSNNEMLKSPQIVTIKRKEIFTPKLNITLPDSIEIENLVDYLFPLAKKESFIERFPSYPLPNNEPDKAFLDNLYSQALLGNRKAQFQLAQYLQQGVGTDKDITNAKLWYEKSARQNYLEAQYQLGLLLLIDLDNPKEGLYWLEQSAFKGNQHAQFALALLYQQGFKGKVEKDDKRSLAMYHLSASGNYAPAKFNLAQLYVLNGFNDQNLQKKRAHHQMLKHLYEDAVKANIEDAKLPLALYYANKKSAHEKQVFAYQTIKQAAIDGNAKAQVLLGMLLERGIGTKPDIAKAIRYYEKSATADNRVAQFILGTYYYQGLWLKKDDAKAISLLNAAGKQGLPYAYYNLAVIRSNQHQDFLTPLKEAAQHGYAKASLFLSDYYLLNDADLNKLQIATKTYHHLAELGYPKANLKLGYMYQQGLIVKKDEKKAAAFYKKAANENNLIAMYLLANIYLSGEVGKPNIKKAKLWYQKAANLGFVPAYVALGFIAENIDYNYAGAIYWYKKAADKNSAVGSRNLALMYRYGKGIKPNNEKAMYWHNKATKENKDLLIKQAAKDRD